jgi:hypothetical protein
MTWGSAHSWWSIVHEAVAEADANCDGRVPWRRRYIDVFPDAESLRRALDYFWLLQATAQVDCESLLGEFVAEHRGLHMVLFGATAGAQSTSDAG